MAATKSISRRVENRIHRPPASSQRTRAPEGTRKKTSSKLPVAESSRRRRREQKPTKPDSVTAVDEVQCARVRGVESPSHRRPCSFYTDSAENMAVLLGEKREPLQCGEGARFRGAPVPPNASVDLIYARHRSARGVSVDIGMGYFIPLRGKPRGPRGPRSKAAPSASSPACCPSASGPIYQSLKALD
ncbi:hypothetical protein NDU88_004858 [Pleurodeles waltl]|uniref:Uncharacterized protein n=1 Tax=Pleurodeles waltl TaxID=8319 RepID=A0AAV7W664_PLEWA|nr:hypothetical protein NDU88_004858 [Pleurodeles waltl]